MTSRSTARAARTTLFSVAAGSATATIVLIISICFALPVRAAPQDRPPAEILERTVQRDRSKAQLFLHRALSATVNVS